MNNAYKFAQELGIKEEGDMEGLDKYVINLEDSDAYSKVYTILDKSDKVDLDTDLTLVSDSVSELTYLGDRYDIRLIANFKDDVYKVIFTVGDDI